MMQASDIADWQPDGVFTACQSTERLGYLKGLHNASLEFLALLLCSGNSMK